MTEKRFERIYEDVDVFCRDHNAKGVSQLIEREDYDRIVDLLNEQQEQIEDLKDANVRCCNEYSYFHKRMMQVEKENEQLKEQLEICKDARQAYKQDWKACVSYCDTYKDEIHTLKDNIQGLIEENKMLKNNVEKLSEDVRFLAKLDDYNYKKTYTKEHLE